MVKIFNKKSTPKHLFTIPELDFSENIFSERLTSPWFRLGALTIKKARDKKGVKDCIERQTILIPCEAFKNLFDGLTSVGNVISGLGKPGGEILYDKGKQKHTYFPFYKFNFAFSSGEGEPLVFINYDSSINKLCINPDLLLYFELEESSPSSMIWKDPRRGVEVIVGKKINDETLEIIDIRTDYLVKYLQIRQKSLLIGAYRGLCLYEPSQDKIDLFKKGEVVLGSKEAGAKAIFQNWGLRDDLLIEPFLQRRLHLWYQIEPIGLDIEEHWSGKPTFDIHSFMFATRVGPVAPAQWKQHFKNTSKFKGTICDFMEPIYFNQTVLSKYEGISGYNVEDNGSVHCSHYWGLYRSTYRLGNELLVTSIGDFAEGVPYEEWPHWGQYAVDPPDKEFINLLKQEQTVINSVNVLIKTLNNLNMVFSEMSRCFGINNPEPLWNSSIECISCRQLKWIYPANANEDEFLKRVTLLSTFVIEGLNTDSMRLVIKNISKELLMNNEKNPKPLGSRNLLQRISLIVLLYQNFGFNMEIIPSLVRQAEGKEQNKEDLELNEELKQIHSVNRNLFAPIAFLYDLRVSGGIAHAPNKEKTSETATKLGLPGEKWQRHDFLSLVIIVSDSINQIAHHLEDVTKRRIYEL